jgi:SPP1 family predicted phage head-tail adaptor
MRSGSLRRRLTFQAKARVDRPGGGWSEDWKDAFTVWGSVRGLSARERIVAMQTEGEVTHQIRIRYRAGITPAMRVLDADAIYDIDPPIDPDGRRHELVMTARQVVLSPAPEAA